MANRSTADNEPFAAIVSSWDDRSGVVVEAEVLALTNVGFSSLAAKADELMASLVA
jgi:hypothetical protein